MEPALSLMYSQADVTFTYPEPDYVTYRRTLLATPWLRLLNMQQCHSIVTPTNALI